MKKEFVRGLRDGAPIMAGYFAVSFSFGILAVQGGLSVLQAALTSLTNVTSAGQFAGLQIIVAGGTILEMILTQLIINLRYALMSLSLSQKLDEGVTFWQRLVIAFANTDEIFAVAMSHAGSLKFPYMVGLQILPIFGWTAGTALGAAAGNILPAALTSALGVALYGMFIAVVVPAARRARPVLAAALLAIAVSCVLDVLNLSAGVSIIICTVAVSALMAVLHPVEEGDAQ
ncbi:MAG: AzlC family ABC transporter permease [Oscillospiraceae bacterium]|nr:AzlC family ABC transporter permease [Oscillospiraceae bacterium]